MMNSRAIFLAAMLITTPFVSIHAQTCENLIRERANWRNSYNPKIFLNMITNQENGTDYSVFVKAELFEEKNGYLVTKLPTYYQVSGQLDPDTGQQRFFRNEINSIEIVVSPDLVKLSFPRTRREI